MHAKKLPSISLYKRIAVSFLVLTIILVAVIIYFSWGRAVIKIEPSIQKSRVEFFINMGRRSGSTENLADLIPAKILETTIDGAKIFSSTGKKKREGGGDIVGKITIQNRTGQEYNFVARTRFLSKEGILFRMKNPARIPADGDVEVEVYADDKNFTGALNPTTFTIPGLRKEKRKLIYGVTSRALVAGGEEVYYITDEDVEKAKLALIQQLKTEALSNIQDKLKFRERLFNEATQVEVIEEESKPAVGVASEDFKLSLKVKVIALSLDEKELESEMKMKIIEHLLADRELLNFNPINIKYTLEKYDAAGRIIAFKVSYPAETVIAKSDKIFDKENLVGLTEKEVKNYFENFDEIRSVEVDFTPFWVRRVPNMADRIEIILLTI